MDSYLQYRTNSAKYRAVDRAVKPWFQQPVAASRVAQIADAADAAVTDVALGFKRSRHTFAEEKKKSKSDDDKSSSESDGEGGRRMKKKEKSKKRKRDEKKKEEHGGGKSICWKGWERVPGTEPYSDNSCRKK